MSIKYVMHTVGVTAVSRVAGWRPKYVQREVNRVELCFLISG